MTETDAIRTGTRHALALAVLALGSTPDEFEALAPFEFNGSDAETLRQTGTSAAYMLGQAVRALSTYDPTAPERFRALARDYTEGATTP